MTCELIPIELSDEQKGHICGILSVGCDRQTAADYVGCSLADIRRAIQHDSSFAADVRHAEAGVELSHMRNVQETAKDKKDWRASVWWLERRSPERYGRRNPGVVTAGQLTAFVAILADVVKEDVRDDEDRARLLARFRAIAASVEQMLRDREAGRIEPSDSTGPFTLDALLGDALDTGAADRADTGNEN